MSDKKAQLINNHLKSAMPVHLCDVKPVKYQLAKVNILHVDGSVSQMRIELPDYGMSMEPLEHVAGYVGDLAFQLSKFHIDIIGYQVFMFSVNNGVESECGHHYPVILKPDCVIKSMQ